MSDNNIDKDFPIRERKKGDRWDGYRLKKIPAFNNLMPYLMKKREGSYVEIKQTFDVTNLIKFLDEQNEKLKNQDGPIKKYTYFNVLMTIVVRTLALKPRLNRFIAHYRYYQRHKIVLSYVAKKAFTIDAPETTVISEFERYYNIDDVAQELTKCIGDAKEELDDTGDFVEKLFKLPWPIIKFFIAILDFFTFIGFYPKMLRDIDPMQTSAMVANLGSIGLENVPYHHLYNRGTSSLVIVFGKIHKELFNTSNGFEERDVMQLSLTIDERISEGFYYASALKVIEDLLDNPEQLLERIKDFPIDE